MILGLQTTTFGAYGGIPTYNRMVCRALNELDDCAAFGDKRVLIARDQTSDLRIPATELPNIRLEAFGGNNAAFVRRVLAMAWRQRIDLALVGHVNYAPLGMMLKRLRPAIRWGIMVHGVEVWSKLSRMKRRALQAADFVISVSEYTKAKMVEVNGVGADRVHILANAIAFSEEITTETQRHREDETKGPETGTVRLLSVARLESGERYKGVDTMIKALPAITARVPDLQYVVVGRGSDLERHRRLASESGVGDRVHFLGSVDDATLRKCYQACDVFVLPSAGEGFGIVYLEAMYYGKPVIAADSRAVPEVVKNDETGLLVEYGNIEQLAEAISSLCENAALREQLGRAGHQRLQQNFAYEQFKRKLHEIVLRELPVTVPIDSRVTAEGVASADG